MVSSILRDSVNNSQQEISVEEYKRPKFFTEIKKPEGTYRVNDMITVTGNAKAYAGNNIDGAKVVTGWCARCDIQSGGDGADSYRGKIWPPYGNRESWKSQMVKRPQMQMEILK